MQSGTQPPDFIVRWPDGDQLMTTADRPTVAQRGFHLSLPQGFMTLPVEDAERTSAGFQDLTNQVAEQFGLTASDDNATEAATAFAQTSSLIGEGEVDFSAIAFYKSPDDALRPVMVTLTGITIPSDHRSRGEAVENLIELHGSSQVDAAEEIQLPAGPAVATVTEEQNALVMNDERIHVLTRQLSAWVPDRDGTTIGVVSVTTNSFQDWERICVLALDIFDTFGWEPISGENGAQS